jgi:orotate phosphoribosyltransferase
VGSLFAMGNFVLHSGARSRWKIDCDMLGDEDWATLAMMITERIPRPFGSVIGIPRGGLTLAQALKPYATEGPTLIVDDVLTTGNSMELLRRQIPNAMGAVVFARGPCPSWVVPLFQMGGRLAGCKPAT